MRILQGKSSLPLGNNPRPGGSTKILIWAQIGRLKHQDKHHTSEENTDNNCHICDIDHGQVVILDPLILNISLEALLENFTNYLHTSRCLGIAVGQNKKQPV